MKTELVLQSGYQSSIVLPNVRRSCKFVCNYKRLKREHTKLKIPAHEDDKLIQLAFENRVEFAMDAGTLRHFLVGPWAHRREDYAVNVNIIRRIHEGTVARLCILNRPVLASRAHQTTISRHLAKWILKDNLWKSNDDKNQSKKSKAFPSNDKWGLEEISSMNLETGKRYAIISLDSQEKYRVLVRTKGQYRISQGEANLDSRQLGNPISFTAKPEFLPEIGAEKLHQEERIWNSLTAHLKDSIEHINFRVELGKYNCLQIESNEVKVAFSELSIDVRNLLSTRIQRFYTLLDLLKGLELGSYLIVQDNEKKNLRVYTSQDISVHSNTSVQSETSDVKLHQQETITDPDDLLWNLAFKKWEAYSENVDENWLGLDPHLPLMWHVVQGRIPGSFNPT